MIWCYRKIWQYLLIIVAIVTAIYFTVSLGGGPKTYIYMAFIVVAVYTFIFYYMTVNIEDGITIYDGLVKITIPFILVQHIEERNNKLIIHYGYKDLTDTYVIKPRHINKFKLEMVKVAPAIPIVKEEK